MLISKTENCTLHSIPCLRLWRQTPSSKAPSGRSRCAFFVCEAVGVVDSRNYDRTLPNEQLVTLVHEVTRGRPHLRCRTPVVPAALPSSTGSAATVRSEAAPLVRPPARRRAPPPQWSVISPPLTPTFFVYQSGGLQKGRCGRNRSRQSRSQTCQRYTGRIGDLCSASGTHTIRRSQPYAPDELLRDREGIEIGRTTLRRILVRAGLNSHRRRRPPKHRVRRQHMAREGMLIQIDGSYHRWLGEDGPQFTLLLAVDDATGCIVNALFCELENTRSYFLLMRHLIQSYGIPIALYSDRHAVFKHTPPSETASAPTQFSRAMCELGVQLIFARSPQAKGRVERTAGTLQDRLVSELWLAGATTIDDANRVLQDFLPRFNSRFKVPAQVLEVAYRAVDGAMCLERVLCFKYRRRAARDNTVRYPLAHPAADARHGPTELRRSSRRCVGGVGR